MAWRTNPVEQRAQLVSLMAHRSRPVQGLCAVFGVSRKTAYKWLGRYRAAGLDGLMDRSRAPRRRPQALSPDVEDRLRALRERYPLFGPKKLRVMLQLEHPAVPVPAVSTIGALLRRAALSQPRVRHVRARPRPTALRVATAPNVVWTADFKGQFRLGDRSLCYPLTIADAYSRFVLRVAALRSVERRPTHTVFDAAFREYGLPETIRTDGGPPFCNVGPLALTRLSVWWIKLGIVPERIAPGCPQQNGRHERMHRTLKAYVARPPQYDRREQQAAHERFRHFFNATRPHEALGLQPPAGVYVPSPRRYDGHAPDPAYPGFFERRRVQSHGELSWRGRWLFISEALCGETLGLQEQDDGLWRVFFGPHLLGHLLDRHLHLGLIPLNTKLSRRVSPMSPD
jgi:transposase InsO family protein